MSAANVYHAGINTSLGISAGVLYICTIVLEILADSSLLRHDIALRKAKATRRAKIAKQRQPVPMLGYDTRLSLPFLSIANCRKPITTPPNTSKPPHKAECNLSHLSIVDTRE